MRLGDVFFHYAGLVPQTDLFQQLSYTASRVAADAGYGVQHLLNRYPTKSCGALSLAGNTALTVQGLQIMDPYILSSCMSNVTSDVVLIVHGDPKAKNGEPDPQDAPFSWRNMVDPKNHPVETSNTLEGLGGVPMIMYALHSGAVINPGLVINGLGDTVANFTVAFIRQKPEATKEFQSSFLNKPIIKQIANFIETDPPATGSIIALSTLGSVGIYELAQGGGFVGDGALSPWLLAFSGFGIASEVVNMLYVDKRRMDDTLANNDESTPS